MDQEISTTPPSDSRASDVGIPTTEPQPETLPGLDAIRGFFNRRWIRGIWAWLCLFGCGIRAAWKWLDKNAGPIARGIEKGGNTAVRISRGAVAVGHSAGEVGGKLSAWGGEQRDAGGVRLRRIGEGIRRFGGRATRIGTQAEDVAESVEDLGEELVSITGGEDRKNRSALASPRRERGSSDRHRGPAKPRNPRVAASEKVRALPDPVDATPPQIEPTPETAALPEADSDGELPEATRERIRALGKRKRSKPLPQLILDICTVREGATVGEPSEWLGMDASILQKSHLRPMVKAGQLALRYPENPSHPDQAYRAGNAGAV